MFAADELMHLPDNPLDAPLLRTLLALLDERSVTRAAVSPNRIVVTDGVFSSE